MKIMIDDIRNIDGVDIVYRTDNEVIENIHNITDDDVLFMDNDLGTNLDGYQLLEMIIETHNIHPEKVVLLTMNPVGRLNMERILIHNGYAKINYREFERI